jgi:hypothetical protein
MWLYKVGAQIFDNEVGDQFSYNVLIMVLFVFCI